MNSKIFRVLWLTVSCFWVGGSLLYGQMVIGGSTPSPSAILDLQSTSKGLLPPRMTTAQRDAIANPAKGLIFFNTTENCIQINTGEPSAPAWKNLSVGETLPETGNVVGNILYWDGTAWVRVAAGQPGQVLTLSQGGIPIWTGVSLATVTTTAASSITTSTAVVGGNVTADGGSSVLSKGVVYGTSTGPTLANSVINLGSGVGSFSGTISGLSPGTVYYFRAFATNGIGTAYGNEYSFSTNTGSGSGSTPIAMKSIGGTTFSMGCTTTLGAVNFDPYCGSVEMPVHTVTLSTFQIGETEVTQADWLTVMETNPSSNTNPACLQCPVENVSWYDAVVFCNRLSEANGLTPCYYKDSGYSEPFGKFGSLWYLSNTGDVYWKPSTNGYRLPTEAEWEYAARGGSSTFIYSGSDNSNDVAWYDTNSGNGTKTTKLKSPNGIGLYDMSGNVYEWCWDYHGSYSSSPQTDPKGVSVGYDRIFRGGSYYIDLSYCRVAWRLHGFGPGLRRSFLGFRLARTP